MAPVYGTFSCLSMWIGDHTGYLIYIRDIYESIGNNYFKKSIKLNLLFFWKS